MKALWRQGKEQSANKGPLAVASILSLQDAIELWLGVAAEELKLDISKDQFPRALDRICEAGRLPDQPALKRLNRARTALKHHGIIPANFQLFLEPVDAFLYEGTRVVFNLSFADLSLLHLVADSVKPYLEKATKLLDEEDIEAAVTEIAKAFYILSNEMAQRTASLPGRPNMYGTPSRGNAWLRDAVTALDKDLIAVHSRLTMLELGIDVMQFIRFQGFMPLVVRSLSGRWEVTRIAGHHPRVEADADEAKDCLDFVIDVAIRLAEQGKASDQAQNAAHDQGERGQPENSTPE